jgi:hypothetical protein
MADFGIRRGLAQSFGFDQATADLVRRQEQMRQAKIYAENQAKMQAEDYDYNTAINAWDNTAIREFAQNELKQLGAWERENPDWKYNVEKRIERNNRLKNLKTGKPVMEGLQVDANKKAMEAWMQDPKNAPLLDTPEFNKTKEEYKNYLETGSTDRVLANRKLFTFQPPEERVDTWGELAKIAAATEYDSESDSYMRGVRTRKQYVSDPTKLRRAQYALTDQKLSRTLQQEYNKYLSNEVPEGQKPLSIDRYVYEKMKDFFPASKYNDTHYQVKEEREPRDSDGTRTVNDLGLYTNIVDAATLNPGKPIAANKKGARALIAGDDPTIDLGSAVFKTPDGTYTPLNNLVTGNFRTNRSEVIFDPKTKQHYISADVTLDNESIEDAFKTISPVNDPFWWFDDPDVDPKYKEDFSVQGNNVTFKAYFPIEKGNTSLSAEYNHAAGQTLEKSDTDQPNIPQYKFSPDGTMYEDVSTKKIYSTKTKEEIK